jgi:carboxyl-terminal processing protease
VITARPAAGALVAVVALVMIAAVAAPLGVQGQTDRPIRERTVAEDLQMFSQVLNQIRVNHPDDLAMSSLFRAAIEGLVRAADPHSYVIRYDRLTPEKEREVRDGRAVRIPVAFRMVGGAHVVVGVHPGSEAVGLDILPGDVLVAIDGEPVLATSTVELELTLAGPRNSSVRLEVERRRADGSLVRLERTVRRERLSPPSAVVAAMLLADGTGYVRVTTFDNDRVAADLQRELRDLERQGMSRLVLDLRDNGGGLLAAAGDVAGLFLPRGALVYTTEGRKAEVTDTVRVGRALRGDGRQYPVAVLVNEGTASASEVVAGALQDHDRAIVVGQTTFGKALIMQGFPLTDGSVMVLVIGTVRTPCGRSIQREYRSISTRDYFHATSADRDRAGRPACTTPAGRTVYGGGGVFPDVVLEPDPTPPWLARVHEQDLLLRWLPGLLDEHAPALSAAIRSPAPALPDPVVPAFRAFAAEQGLQLPTDGDADTRLANAILHRAALALDGPDGYYRMVARMDPDVLAAAQALADTGQ